jgi:hypothetical protein
MKFEDLIGFIISIAAFIFLMIRSAMKKNQSTDEEEEELQAPLPPPIKLPIIVKKPKYKAPLIKEKSDYAKMNTSIVDRYSGSSVVSSHYANMAAYEVTGKSHPSRAHNLISSLKSKKNMVILKEIIGTPKGFR